MRAPHRRQAASALTATMALGLASALILGPTSRASARDTGGVAGHNRAGLTAARLRRSDPLNWPAYLYSYEHPSFAAGDTRINAGNVGRLVRKWHFRGDRPTLPGQPARGFVASPTVSGGAIYIGSDTGWFYKLSEGTGKVLAKRFLGFQLDPHCTTKGIIATATVATERNDGALMVYIAAPPGYLYALRASDLSVKWRSVIAGPSGTVNNYFPWSSPTVVNGRIYVGVSSNCDAPLVPGALTSYDQVTGTRIARFDVMPPQARGGSIWSSAAAGPAGDIYVTTGNPVKNGVTGYSDSILKLNPGTLALLGSFTVPADQQIPDGDFGASPVIFGKDVGACNKNGIFYALNRNTMRRAWSVRVTAKTGTRKLCIAAAAYDGSSLYLAGQRNIIRGKTYRGSLTSVDATTGAVQWRTGLPNGVNGTPTINGSGIIAVGTWLQSIVPDAIYLINASNGEILRTLSKGHQDFGQSVFANGHIVTADLGGVSDWVIASALTEAQAHHRRGLGHYADRVAGRILS
jgi:outer membrane protein assembly factor BamB